METLFVVLSVLSLNERRGSSEEIWPLKRVIHSFTVTQWRIPTLIKYSSFLGVENALAPKL